MPVGNSQYLDDRRKLPIDHSEGETLEQELASAMRAGRPALRGLGNHANGAVEFGGKSRSYRRATLKVPLESSFVFQTRFLVELNFLAGHE